MYIRSEREPTDNNGEKMENFISKDNTTDNHSGMEAAQDLIKGLLFLKEKQDPH